MSFIGLFLIAVGLSMDAFAVSICKGLSVKKLSPKHALLVGVYFGGFQFLMPVIGYLLGFRFEHLITNIDHWIAFVLLAFIGGLFIEKSKGQPVISGVGLVLGDAACYVLGTAWFVFQMQCELGYALTVCVYPFIALDLAKIVVSCIVGALLRKRLTQAGVLKLQNAVSE